MIEESFGVVAKLDVLAARVPLGSKAEIIVMYGSAANASTGLSSGWCSTELPQREE